MRAQTCIHIWKHTSVCAVRTRMLVHTNSLSPSRLLAHPLTPVHPRSVHPMAPLQPFLIHGTPPHNHHTPLPCNMRQQGGNLHQCATHLVLHFPCGIELKELPVVVKNM